MHHHNESIDGDIGSVRVGQWQKQCNVDARIARWRCLTQLANERMNSQQAQEHNDTHRATRYGEPATLASHLRERFRRSANGLCISCAAADGHDEREAAIRRQGGHTIASASTGVRRRREKRGPVAQCDRRDAVISKHKLRTPRHGTRINIGQWDPRTGMMMAKMHDRQARTCGRSRRASMLDVPSVHCTVVLYVTVRENVHCTATVTTVLLSPHAGMCSGIQQARDARQRTAHVVAVSGERVRADVTAWWTREPASGAQVVHQHMEVAATCNNSVSQAHHNKSAVTHRCYHSHTHSNQHT